MRKFKALGNKREIRLAMLGMVAGNGHPYSWSAIFNGYDPVEMVKCPFPAISAYLDLEPKKQLRIPNVRVTHIWTDQLRDARHIAKTTFIPNVLEQAEDAVGHVDAVIVATDKGNEHVQRCRAFVDAGIPIFVDKPLVDNEEDLQTFCQWINEGAIILSSSSMRYCKEYLPYRKSTHNLGELRYVSITTNKSWERYGMHALEGVYPILGPGFLSARNTGTPTRNVVHYKHRSGIDVLVIAIEDMLGGFGTLTLCGTKAHAYATVSDHFYAFKTQLCTFIDYLRTSICPFPFSETIELVKMLIAATKSREDLGREVRLTEI